MSRRSLNWLLAVFSASLVILAWSVLLVAVFMRPATAAVPAQDGDDGQMEAHIGMTDALSPDLRVGTTTVAVPEVKRPARGGHTEALGHACPSSMTVYQEPTPQNPHRGKYKHRRRL